MSLDSVNNNGEHLRGVTDLTARLCAITDTAPTTTLQRVATLLTPAQREEELVRHYNCAKPGHSVAGISRYLWRRIFNFNIDDVLEKSYAQDNRPMQELDSLTYASTFEPTPVRDRVQVIHLHGFVGEPETQFVFSLVDYARMIQDANPWVALLAGILPTEPFIVSGTSLNEVDVQAFLRPRENPAPQRARGPSLLVEPRADRITKEDCRRLNLVLVEASIGEFFEWLQELIPAPPTIADLVIPGRAAVLTDTVDQRTKLRFFSDFQLVSPAELPRPITPSPFLYGREPSWGDIQAHVDMERSANLAFLRELTVPHDPAKAQVICLTDDEAIGGTGKTTILKRVGHDLAARGEVVFYRVGEYRADVQVAATCLRACVKRPILLYDNLADHADEVLSLSDTARTPFVVLGADRRYRLRHLDNVLGSGQWKSSVAKNPTNAEYRSLIEVYARADLLASDEFVKHPARAVRRIEGDPLAIAVCRLLNDFRPLDIIAQSMWNHGPAVHHLPYLIACLAHHCHYTGLRLQLLHSAVPHPNLPEMFDDATALSLDLHPDSDDFVVPTNQTLGDAILRFASEQAPQVILDAFVRLAGVLAPYVNRAAIVRRSSEALIARRLFDADRIVKPFLQNRAELFYAEVQQQWRWNSRYWEQCALLAADSDMDIANDRQEHVETRRAQLRRRRFPDCASYSFRVIAHGDALGDRIRHLQVLQTIHLG